MRPSQAQWKAMVVLLRETRGLGVMKGCRLPDGSKWGNCRNEPERTAAERAESERIGKLVRECTWLGGADFPRAYKSGDWNPRAQRWELGWNTKSKRK